MTKEHKNADLLRAIADGKQMQRLNHHRWENITVEAALYRLSQGMIVRIKPPFITINGIECPEPTENSTGFRVSICLPNNGEEYYVTYNTPADAREVFEAICSPFKVKNEFYRSS